MTAEERTPEDYAKRANLALLMSNGISEVHAGFDQVLSVNADGLKALTHVIRSAVNDALERAAEVADREVSGDASWYGRGADDTAERIARDIRALKSPSPEG
jgi:hypothetical protein